MKGKLYSHFEAVRSKQRKRNSKPSKECGLWYSKDSAEPLINSTITWQKVNDNKVLKMKMALLSSSEQEVSRHSGFSLSLTLFKPENRAYSSLSLPLTLCKPENRAYSSFPLSLTLCKPENRAYSSFSLSLTLCKDEKSCLQFMRE
jgi:hypothetical protein